MSTLFFFQAALGEARHSCCCFTPTRTACSMHFDLDTIACIAHNLCTPCRGGQLLVARILQQHVAVVHLHSSIPVLFEQRLYQPLITEAGSDTQRRTPLGVLPEHLSVRKRQQHLNAVLRLSILPGAEGKGADAPNQDAHRHLQMTMRIVHTSIIAVAAAFE